MVKGKPKPRTNTDPREPGAKDRDRILYTAAFRRLAGVTQVVGPLEGHVFHNRLTHTLEVAQLARRLAEHLNRSQRDLAEAGGGIDPEMAEAAALAHDLGHPPFGHVAEDQLRELASDTVADGFEGNAQSFRILSRLATVHETFDGLDLTRGTLNAVLKYPWLKREAESDRPNKYGAYESEEVQLTFARGGQAGRSKSLEAAIMDHADDIAYSVHDVDDFYRAGLIPLQEIKNELDAHVETFRNSKRVKVPSDKIDAHLDGLREMAKWSLPDERYEGEFRQRGRQRTRSSKLIEDFVTGVVLAEKDGRVVLEIPPATTVKMKFLQNLVWQYVIDSPRLATQQHGQREIIRCLFRTYRRAVVERDMPLVPPTFREELNALPSRGAEKENVEVAAKITRIAVDIVASFTDAQAVALYRRLTGVASGSVMDILAG